MDTKLYYIFLFLFLLCTVSYACDIGLDELLEKSAVKEVKLTIDKKIENQYCQSWVMTESEIKEFFSKANIISGELRHSSYDWGGCNIGGVLSSKETFHRFVINAGGTASLFIEEKELMFGCKGACKHIFDFGFYE